MAAANNAARSTSEWMVFLQFIHVCIVLCFSYVWTNLKNVISQMLSGAKRRSKNKILRTRAHAKLVVITGADTGFGRLLSEKLAVLTEFQVLALCLTESAAEEITWYGTSHGGNLVGLKCDVTSEQDVEIMHKKVQAMLSERGSKLYGIVNNAGIVNPGDFCWYKDIEIYQRTMDVNFFGQLRITQSLLPIMMKTSSSEGARIINMSSVCGASASPGNSAYNASKFAVEAWSDSLRIELKPFNIQVVKVRPGQIDTRIQSDYFRNLFKNYASASTEVRSLYGGDSFSDKIKAVLAASSGTRLTKPEVVVDAIADMLIYSTVEPYYWIGTDAQTLWRALSTLPTKVADSAKEKSLYFAPEVSTKTPQ